MPNSAIIMIREIFFCTRKTRDPDRYKCVKKKKQDGTGRRKMRGRRSKSCGVSKKTKKYEERNDKYFRDDAADNYIYTDVIRNDFLCFVMNDSALGIVG